MISFDEAISHSERRARRLWFISLLWVLIMLLVAVMFLISIREFDKTQDELTKLHTQIAADEQQALRLIGDLERTKQTLSTLEKQMLEKLSAHEAEIHVLHLMVFSPQELTEADKEFVRQQAGKQQAEVQRQTAGKLVVQAFSEFINHNYQRSYEIFTQALSADPRFAVAYAGRARANNRLGESLKAYEDYTQALQLEKDDANRPQLLIERAMALEKLERLEEAQVDYAEANKSSDAKDRGFALNGLGLVSLRKKDWQGAENNFRDAAEADPSHANWYLENIGLIYLAQSDWGRAYNWATELPKMSRSGEIIWNWMVQALAAEKLGKSQESRDAAKKFVTSAVDDPKFSLSDFERYLSADLARLAEELVQL